MPGINAILPKIIALCNRHGYIYKARGINNIGASGQYELGPLGVELKQNMCNEWWYSMVTSQDNIYGAESPCLEVDIQDGNKESSTGHSVQIPSYDSTHISNNMSLEQIRNQHGCTPTYALRSSLYQGILLHYIKTRDFVNKQLPFGIAQKGLCFRQESHEEEEKFIYDTQEYTQLSVQFYCTPKTTTHWLDSWQRDRLQWWRKFAQNPSNFIATDLQTRDGVHMLDIQYTFPWGPATIERICNREKHPMEELQKWMENTDVVYERISDDIHVENLPSNDEDDVTKEQGSVLVRTEDNQKNMLNLKGRDGRRSVLPLTLEMTTGLERGMLAYLLDGFTENQDQKPVTRKVTPIKVMNLHPRLAPIKVAITIRGTGSRQLQEICQYLQGEFRKANITVMVDNGSLSLTGKTAKFDAMGVVFSIFLHEKTIKEGNVLIRNRGETVAQVQHITQVKDLVQQLLVYL